MVTEWSAALPASECKGCVTQPLDSASGPSGEIWTALPIQAQGGPSLQLLRHDSSGALELQTTTHRSQPLYPLDWHATGMSVDSLGELHWVGPSPGSPGTALLHYARDGARVSSRWLLQDTDGTQASFTSHGITLAYAYVASLDATVDPPVPKVDGGVARFDATGELEWSQSWNQSNGTGVMGVTHDGSTFVVTGQTPNVLARLAPDGRVAWARSVDSSLVFGVVNPVTEELVVQSFASAETELSALDRDGNELWRTRVKNVGGGYGLNATADGRIVLANVHVGGGTTTGVLVVSPDGTLCTHHLYDQQDPWVYDSVADERLPFTTGALLGAMRLP
jgi:hypothetical protein